MAIMPTTRRGRFLFYKARQRRRLRKLYQRNRRWRSQAGMGPRYSNRGHHYDGETKQMPRVYPRHFPLKALDRESWEAIGWTPPTKGRWGVPRYNALWPLSSGAWDEANGAGLGYHDRRLLSIPRLRHLPRYYLNPFPVEVAYYDFYPFAYYPSGRPSFAKSMGWVS